MLDSSPPSATYMHQWTGSSLIQLMAWHLFDAKPLPEPMLPYCQLDSWKQISVKFEFKFYHFHSRKYIWKCLPKWWPFCPGGEELTHWGWVTHICVLIGLHNGLSPVRCQAIIWTNAEILLIGPLGTNFSEICIGIQTFSFKNLH